MEVQIDSIVESLKYSFIKISKEISNNSPLKMSSIISKNSSNDDVKKLDIISNEYIIEELLKNKFVKTIASEENSELIQGNKDGNFFVSFDPLDGSSNIDSNITIGTIFAIFMDSNIRKEKIGNSIVAAGYCLYGGSTQLVYTKKNMTKPVVNLYLLDNEKKFVFINELKMPDKGKNYSINESNKYIWNNNRYKNLIDTFIKDSYTQRWVGSLVADAHRTIIKGGFFSYPADKRQNGKLRLLYEAVPFCFIVEQSGGKGYLSDSLDEWRDNMFPENIHEKTPLIIGSKKEIEIMHNIFIKNRIQSFCDKME